MDKNVGPYQRGDSLGPLPFGELVTATHSARSEPLAILFLDDRLAQNHRFRGLLRLEIARAGAVRHAALARFVEVGEHDGALYVVVERPRDGQTLAQAYAEGDPPSRDEAVDLIRRLASGLDAAHGRRLVHGAIDPSSVLVGPGGSVALVGMALSGAVDEAGLDDVVAERTRTEFTAPEQRSGRRAVASADGFALGMLAAALLRVQPPPAGPSDAVGNVLARQCATDPAARYPTCTAFAVALADAIASAAEVAVGARPASTTAPTPGSSVVEPAGSPATPTAEVLSADTESAPLPALAPEPPQLWTAPSPAVPEPASSSMPSESVRMAASPDVVAPSVAPAPSEIGGSLPAHSPAEPTAPVAAPLAPNGAPGRSPPPGGVGGWLRAAIDPPQTKVGAAGSSTLHPGVPAAGWSTRAGLLPAGHELAPVASEVAVTTTEPTPAMLALLKTPEQRDPIGDAIVWAASRAPALDAILDRYCPDGRVGPVPLGVAVAGGLALLMLLAGQGWPATVLIMIVVVLYGTPRLAAVLTASERASLKAVRVTGGAHIRPAPEGAVNGVPALDLPNNASLSIRENEYALLSRVGHPITVERPVYGVGGVREVVVRYDLPGAIVTYLAPSVALLDVRDAGGSVLYRRPPYAGEPGDVLWSSGEPAPPAHATGDPSADATPATVVVQSSSGTTGPDGRRQVASMPLPSAAQASLKTAAESSARLAAVIIAVPVIAFVVLPHYFGSFGFFALIAVAGIFSQGGGGAVARAFRLWNSRQATSMVRVVGPVILSRHRNGKTHRHVVRLDDDTTIKVDAQTYRKLTDAGEIRVEEAGLFDFDSSRQSPDGFLQSQHEIPGAIVTYEPTGPLLLEVRNPFGEILYREPALGEGDLGAPDRQI